jgi:hypothetical protein
MDDELYLLDHTHHGGSFDHTLAAIFLIPFGVVGSINCLVYQHPIRQPFLVSNPSKLSPRTHIIPNRLNNTPILPTIPLHHQPTTLGWVIISIYIVQRRAKPPRRRISETIRPGRDIREIMFRIVVEDILEENGCAWGNEGRGDIRNGRMT